MATDATGTPTALGIPKYNPSADAPSGLGFNAAMDAIDALITQAPRSAAISGIVTGTVPVWNGSAWVKPTGTPDGTKFLRDDGSWQAAGGSAPTGAVMPFAGAAAPTGWLLADGATVSQATYAALFALIGHTYGADPGGGNFILPDLRGRAVFGKGTHTDVDALGDNDGVAVAGRRAKHKHVVNDPGHGHTTDAENITSTVSPGSAGGFTVPGGWSTANVNGNTTGISVGPQTGNEPTDGPAFLVLNYIIKT